LQGVCWPDVAKGRIAKCAGYDDFGFIAMVRVEVKVNPNPNPRPLDKVLTTQSPSMDKFVNPKCTVL